VKSRATFAAVAVFASIVGLTFGAKKALSASTAPLSGAWNIASTGKANSSGELLFRVTTNDGSDPVEVTVSVTSGTNEDGVARKIRQSMSTQLRSDRFNVTLGSGANVLVTDQNGEPTFTLELLDSDVENVRVLVQSVQPVAPPTVPEQRTPANPPQGTSETPAGPGNSAPPSNAPAQTPPPNNQQVSPPASSPPPNNSQQSPPPSTPAPQTSSGSGAPASSPPQG
jgi:hypothetical protein